jgi:hypothetical protein
MDASSRPDLATARRFEARAIAECEAQQGLVILTSHLVGLVGDTDRQADFRFDPPLPVRVLPVRFPDQLIRWNGEWLDPLWNVEVVQLDHPGLPPEGLRSCWVYGPSYNFRTGERQPCHQSAEESSWLGRVVFWSWLQDRLWQARSPIIKEQSK